MRIDAPSRPARSRFRRILAATAALVLGGGIALAGAGPAFAGAFTVSIASTNATSQPSGSVFTYQVNVACAATNDPQCAEGQIVIPIGAPIDADWGIEAIGGLVVSTERVGGNFVITLPAVIPAGTSQAIELRVTPPNLTTPSGTTWSLLPSIVTGDPDTTTGATAPAAATSTATATVPLSVSKGSDRTFYEAGEIVEYSITATCPATKPLGSIAAESMSIVDTLPVGIEPVIPVANGGVWNAAARTITWTYGDAASVPVACGGTAGDAAAATFTFQAEVGPVGPGQPLESYEQVLNTVAVTAIPVGGGASNTASDDRAIVVLADGDVPAPGTASVNKGAAGPVNRSDGATPSYDATYPGRWLPNAVAENAPASVTAPNPARYIIEPRTQFPGFEYEIVDSVPCLDDLSGVVYSPSTGTCDAPAFHVLSLRLDHAGAAPTAGYAPQFVDLEGDLHPMEASTSGTNWTGWVVPTAFLTEVSGIIVPRDIAQIDRRDDRITVYGYADGSLGDGVVLHNIAEAEWFAPSATLPTSADTDAADLHVIDVPQIGITKAMANIGSATGPLARLNLTGSLLSPGIPDEPLIITDLLPLGSSLETDADDITAELRPDGGTAIELDADDLIVELIPDFVDDRELLRITVPASLLTAAGRYQLVVDPLEVRKPTEPGVYENAAQVFYDSATLADGCAAGAIGNEDPNGLRGDPTAVERHCAATATFTSALSSSGAFDLRKTVQGDYDDAPQEFPNVGHVKLTDGLADYQLIWQNTGAPALEGLVLYDVFPHVGDTGVSGGQSAQARGSEFRPALRTVGAAPTGVTISYSASDNPCRPEVYPTQGACDNDWTADPATLGGLAEVLAVRLVSAEEYQTGEGIELDFQMSVPTVDKDQVAWNSVAAFAQTTGGTALLPTESPKVGITASDQRLALEKTVDAEDSEVGDRLTYDITVTNIGTGDSVATTVNDPLPAGVALVSASDAGVYDAASRTVTWDVPVLSRDAAVTFTLAVAVEAGAAGRELVNAARLVNPPGYSPPVFGSECEGDAAASCALTTIPALDPGASEVASTGVTISITLIAGGIAAIALGIAAVAVRRRTREQ
jgi:uncharacterized repeat protein (TIGR01451 family)